MKNIRRKSYMSRWPRPLDSHIEELFSEDDIRARKQRDIRGQFSVNLEAIPDALYKRIVTDSSLRFLAQETALTVADCIKAFPLVSSSSLRKVISALINEKRLVLGENRGRGGSQQFGLPNSA